jgi:hypothetical protein
VSIAADDRGTLDDRVEALETTMNYFSGIWVDRAIGTEDLEERVGELKRVADHALKGYRHLHEEFNKLKQYLRDDLDVRRELSDRVENLYEYLGMQDAGPQPIILHNGMESTTVYRLDRTDPLTEAEETLEAEGAAAPESSAPALLSTPPAPAPATTSAPAPMDVDIAPVTAPGVNLIPPTPQTSQEVAAYTTSALIPPSPAGLAGPTAAIAPQASVPAQPSLPREWLEVPIVQAEPPLAAPSPRRSPRHSPAPKSRHGTPVPSSPPAPPELRRSPRLSPAPNLPRG